MSLLLLFAGGNFTPKSVSGLTIWLDAAQGVAKDGSDIVTSWADQSGNSNTFSTGTGIRKPQYVASAINSLPAINGRHDGTNASNLAAADSASMNYTDFSLFIVASRLINFGATEQLAGKYVTAGSMREHRLVIGSTDQLSGGVSPDGAAVTTSFIASPTIATSTPFIADLQYSASSQTVALNRGTTNTQANPASAFNGTGTYQIFSREGGLDPFGGYIAEFLFYNRRVTSGERLQVLSYLSAKYAITLT